MVSVADVTDLVATLNKNVVPASELFGTEGVVPESTSAKQKLPGATSAKAKRKAKKTHSHVARSIPPSWNAPFPA